MQHRVKVKFLLGADTKVEAKMYLPDLNELLQYKNPAVLKLYEQNYPTNKLPSDQAFVEVLKYLWLTRKHELDLLENKDNENFPQRVLC